MPKYLVDVIWWMGDSFEVDADNRPEVVETARNRPRGQGEFIGGTYQVLSVRKIEEEKSGPEGENESDLCDPE